MPIDSHLQQADPFSLVPTVGLKVTFKSAFEISIKFCVLDIHIDISHKNFSWIILC